MGMIDDDDDDDVDEGEFVILKASILDIRMRMAAVGWFGLLHMCLYVQSFL
jgi:hypothetical protein